MEGGDKIMFRLPGSILLRGTMPSGVFRSCLVSIGLCAGLHATDYYVSPQGNDANPGSQNAPFQSIARGVDSAGPGDRILLMDGTYGSRGIISDGSGGWYRGYASPVNISKSGAPNAWITLKAMNRGSA